MKTLNEIKNDVCLEYGYYTYSIAVSDFKQGRMDTKTFNCIVRDIAREVAKESLKNASVVGNALRENGELVREIIINESNIPNL